MSIRSGKPDSPAKTALGLILSPVKVYFPVMSKRSNSANSGRHRRPAGLVRIVFGLLLCGLAVECTTDRDLPLKGNSDVVIELPEQCIDYEIGLISLPPDQLPYRVCHSGALNDTLSPRDEDGLIMFIYNDRRYYHPITLSRMAMAYLDLFSGTGDSTALAEAAGYLDKLRDESEIINGARYYHYSFDYCVHSDRDWTLKAPWYSGMAQGVALNALVRMFAVTGDSLIGRQIEETYASFLRLRQDHDPWVALIDEAGCYWIEEYPFDNPMRTLNGFIFAIYGLYEYFLLTSDPSVEETLKDCLKTIKNYLPCYRRPGQPGYYDLGSKYYAWNYHLLHIRQLRALEQMTGDPFFGAWADTLESDYSHDSGPKPAKERPPILNNKIGGY